MSDPKDDSLDPDPTDDPSASVVGVKPESELEIHLGTDPGMEPVTNE